MSVHQDDRCAKERIQVGRVLCQATIEISRRRTLSFVEGVSSNDPKRTHISRISSSIVITGKTWLAWTERDVTARVQWSYTMIMEEETEPRAIVS